MWFFKYCILILLLFFSFCNSPAFSLQKPQTPVLFVPGFLGTLPRFNYALRFLFERGVTPEAFDMPEEYKMMTDEIKLKGYTEGKTFFFAGYDWRLPPAKTDSIADGIIHQGAGELTDNLYTTGLDYLAYYLLEAVKANPGLKEVDLVCHSTGGIIARSYIQSLAYNGKVYQDGKAYRLPKIRKLILIGVPAEGAAFAWNPWNGNMLSMQGFGRAGDVLALVYRAVALGFSKVNGYDYIIDKEDIINPLNHQTDETRFIHLYMPSLKNLLPTYPFLISNDTLKELKGTSNENLLLEDINYESGISKNSWANKVSSVDVVFGISNITTEYSERKTGTGGKIVSLSDISNSRNTIDGEIWYRDSTDFNNGDGVVPFRSLISDYTNNPKIKITGWSDHAISTYIDYNITNGRTDHIGMFINPQIVRFIAELLDM